MFRPQLEYSNWPGYLKGSNYRGTPRSAYRRNYVEHFKPVVCSKCSAVFEGMTKFRRHETIEHGKRLYCTFCAKEFTDSGALNKHEKVHRGIRDAKCQHCEFTGFSKTEVLNHMRKSHKEHISKKEQKPSTFLCSICASTFAEKSLLRKHELRVHFKEEWKNEDHKHKCTICGYIGFTRKDVKIHMLKHSSSKPYVCEICQRCAFKTAGQKNYHIRKQHGVEPDKSINPSELLLLPKLPKQPKIHSCTQCSYTSNTSTGLKSHIKIHSDLRQHICEYCPETFKRRDVLVRHTQRHHKVDLRRCRFEMVNGKKTLVEVTPEVSF